MRVRQVRQLSFVALFLCGFVALLRLWLFSIRSPHRSKQEVTAAISPFELKDEDRERLRALEQTGGTKYRAYQRNLRHGMWYATIGRPPGQKNRTTPVEISIFGAYLDTRNKNHLIRAFGVSNSSSETPVRCLVWYLGWANAVMSNATVYDTGRGLYSKELSFQERMYVCQPPGKIEALPKLVAFTFETDNDFNLSVNPIPIAAALPDSYLQHDIGLCTTITYGSVDPMWLVEWIEFNRLLGITEINFHVSNVSDGVTRVLAHYIRTGLVRVKPVDAPIVESCFWCLKLATIPVLNDCMYRNMYRYRYLAVTDIDEIVVPRRHDSLLDLLRHLDIFYPSPAYIFNNVYFFLDFPSPFQKNGSAATRPPTTAPVLTTMTKLWRLKPSERGYATKSIVNPRMCEVIQNHYCLRRTADVSKEYWATEVKHDLGLLHHYKKCHFELQECQRLFLNYLKDNSVEKFKDNLVSRVKETLANISLAIQPNRT